MRRIYILLLLMLACCPMMLRAENGTSYLPLIGIRQGGVVKQGRTIELTMSVDLSEAKIRTQHTIALTPTLVSTDSSREMTSPPIIIDGKTRHKVYLRAQRFENVELPPFHNGSAQAIIRHSSKRRHYGYAVTTPYERWMLDGWIKIHEGVHGCVNCDKGKTEQSLWTGILPAYVLDYKLDSVAPEPEPVEARAETRTARLQFRQDSYNMLLGFKNNRAELDAVSSSIGLVKKNTSARIIDIYIAGYASPEGSMTHNMALSESRAKVLADYIRRCDAITSEMLHTDWKGENWEGFIRVLSGFPNLLKHGKVYEVIERYFDGWDSYKLRLQKLVPPTIYHRLLTEMYPALRRNEYRIEYNVHNFNLEEAHRMVGGRPDLLSLSEVYEVADSYGKGTPRYGKMMATALRYLPTSPSALNKNAVNAISREEYAKAVELLEKSEVTTRSAELLSTPGVAHVGTGQYDKAEDVLHHASEIGSATARHNLEEMWQVIDQL